MTLTEGHSKSQKLPEIAGIDLKKIRQEVDYVLISDNPEQKPQDVPDWRDLLDQEFHTLIARTNDEKGERAIIMTETSAELLADFLTVSTNYTILCKDLTYSRLADLVREEKKKNFSLISNEPDSEEPENTL